MTNGFRMGGLLTSLSELFSVAYNMVSLLLVLEGKPTKFIDPSLANFCSETFRLSVAAEVLSVV